MSSVINDIYPWIPPKIIPLGDRYRVDLDVTYSGVATENSMEIIPERSGYYLVKYLRKKTRLIPLGDPFKNVTDCFSHSACVFWILGCAGHWAKSYSWGLEAGKSLLLKGIMWIFYTYWHVFYPWVAVESASSRSVFWLSLKVMMISSQNVFTEA